MSSNCTVLTKDQYRALALARGTNGGVCFILCVALLVIEVLASRGRGRRNFMQWLLLYLTVVTLFHTGLGVIQMIEELAGENMGFCEALGFFLEWVNWVQLSTTLLLTIYLIYLLNKTVRKCNTTPKTSKKWHYCLLLTGWTPLPLVLVWLPLSTTSGHTQAGVWCWITSISDCTGNTVEFVEQMVMWYAPVLIVAGFSADLALLLTAVYCCWARRHAEIQQESWRNLPLMIAFMLFSLLCGVELAARTHTLLYQTHHYTLWLVYAILLPWRDLILLSAYCLYLYPPTCQQKVEDTPRGDCEVQDHGGSLERSAFVDVETLTARERQKLIANYMTAYNHTMLHTSIQNVS